MPAFDRADHAKPSARPSGRNLQPSDLTPLQLQTLRVIAECVALPLDQLARFLGCRRPTTGLVVSALEKAGCVESRRLVSGESNWIWLRRAGARLSGTGVSAKRFPPAVRGLAHRRAVHEVRLHLEARAPAGRWICEPHLYSQLRCGDADRVPDGVFEIDGERHAIEAELSTKSYAHLRRSIAENSARYDAVVYFCRGHTRRQLDRIKAREEWPKLIVRDLPGTPRPPRPRSLKAKRHPDPWEADILRLIAEQGAIPLDQLARFQGCSFPRAKRIAGALTEARYANCERLLADQPAWLWLCRSGARLAPTSIGWWRPRVGSLDRIRLLNDLRLHLEGREPDTKWITRRTLVSRHGPLACVPDAVLELRNESHALLLRASTRAREGFRKRLDTLSRDHDAVVCFCVNGGVRKHVETLQGHYQWSKLVIRDFPTPG